MIDFLLSILNYIGLIDSEARKDGPSTWSRRHRKLIRVVLIVCWTPFCAGLLILLVAWVSMLEPRVAESGNRHRRNTTYRFIRIARSPEQSLDAYIYRIPSHW